jgi:hypothetical protein
MDVSNRRVSTNPGIGRLLTVAPVQNILSVFVLALGLFAMTMTTLIIVRSYSPVTHWDQWSIVSILMEDGGHLKFARLWQQHNEHRIPFGRLASYADLRYFGGRNVFLLISIYLVQLLHLLVFARMIRRFGRLDSSVFWTAFGFLLYCMFSPIQMENFIWGFQISFVMAGAGASAAFAAAVWYSERANSRSGFLFLGLCVLAAFVSEFSLANGVLVWPMLSLLAYTLRFPSRIQWLLGGIGLLAIAIYLYGYQTPSWHSDPLATIRHPFAAARYVVTYLASSWDPNLPNTSLWPSVSESLTIIAIAVGLIRAVGCVVMRSRANRLEVFLLSDIVFVLMTAAITGLGRMKFPFTAASRYQSIALVFWASFVLLLLSWSAHIWTREAWTVRIQVALILVLMAGASQFGFYEQHAKQRQAELAKGYAALAQNSSNLEVLRPLFPVPEVLPAWYGFLRSRKWGPDPREYGGIDQFVRPAASRPRVKGYQLVPAARCSGFLDTGAQVPGRRGIIAAGGWAWDTAAEKPPIKVILAVSDGTVAGIASVGIPRPDVPKTLPQVKSPNIGWSGEASLSSGTTLRAFALLEDKKSACPLLNEFSTQ